jgi:hypothetical protein
LPRLGGDLRLITSCVFTRGCGAAGSAPRSQRGGQGFESPQLHPGQRPFFGTRKINNNASTAAKYSSGLPDHAPQTQRWPVTSAAAKPLLRNSPYPSSRGSATSTTCASSRAATATRRSRSRSPSPGCCTSTTTTSPPSPSSTRRSDPLTLDRERLLLNETDGIMLVIYHPEPGTESADKLALLASVALTAEQAPTRSTAPRRP